MNELERVRRLITEELESGTPRSAGALSIVPLYGGESASSYMLAHDAIASGELTIGELAGGDVTHLTTNNQAPLPVLIIDGEHLEGAMQDRVLVASALLPAGAKTTLPVACVEQGRWRYEAGPSFGISPDFAYARLRRRTAGARNARIANGDERAADQSEI